MREVQSVSSPLLADEVTEDQKGSATHSRSLKQLGCDADHFSARSVKIQISLYLPSHQSLLSLLSPVLVPIRHLILTRGSPYL